MHTSTHTTNDLPALVWDRHPGGHSRAADDVHKFHVFQSGFSGKGGRHVTAEISCRRTSILVATATVGTVAEAKAWCEHHRTWPSARRA